MTKDELILSICAWLGNQEDDYKPHPTGITSFTVLYSRAPTALEAVLYQPLLCLILQGRKETYSGTRCVSFAAGESLIVSHDLPVSSRVIEASEQVPYIALVLELDIGIVRSLYDEIGETELEEVQASGLEVGETDETLIDAIGRLFDLVNRPTEAKVMVPLILREIHFRLLLARHGAMLRELLQRGSHANHVAKAIAHIKQNYSQPLTVKQMASVAGMSVSSFHEHFRDLTETTPLQYQKELRLLEARRLLRDSEYTVSSAAYNVGYESPTQFSREYSRKFGNPPLQDRVA